MPAVDSFEAAPPVAVATQVAKLQIVLTVVEAIPAGPDPETQPSIPRSYLGRYSFDRLAADGSIVDVREGNLVPHLTAQQITQIKAFLDAMLTKAQGSV